MEPSYRLHRYLFPSLIPMEDNSGSSTMIVALIAILVIVVVGFVAIRMFPSMMGTDNGSSINVELPTGGSSATE